MAVLLVTFPELQARPGFDNVSEGDVTGLLEDASDLVRSMVSPELDDVESPETPGAVRSVVVNMVRRGLTNPTGATQESIGDYSYSVSGSAAATVYMTRREERIVWRAVGESGAVSVPLSNFKLPSVK